MHSASVYRLKDRLLIHPNCPTPAGIRISVAPFVVLPLDANAQEVGVAIERALSESAKAVPHPTDWKKAAAPRLIAAGLKSEAAFQRCLSLVQVSATDHEIRLVPARNGGPTGDSRGFHEIPTAAISLLKSAQQEAIGTAMLNAFKCCIG
jgi:hypothetical protein